MCGRLSQYSGIHDFVAALSMPNALVNHIGDLPLEPYNAAPRLDPATPNERAEELGLHQGEPTNVFEWFKVDPAIGSVRNQGRTLIERV